jgi:hypothetical protein
VIDIPKDVQQAKIPAGVSAATVEFRNPYATARSTTPSDEPLQQVLGPDRRGENGRSSTRAAASSPPEAHARS